LLKRLQSWLEERWPVKAVVRWSLEEEIAGGPRWPYVLGSCTLFLFVVQVVTGVWQLLYYVPTTDHAYDSVTYLRFGVTFGWLVHGLHCWGANFFIVVLGLHMVRVYVWGAYKNPRELTWITGVALLFTAILLMFTGGLLPWDELGYWAAQVGTSMAGTVPWLGEFFKPLLRAGYTMGQLTLSRFFTFHVMLLPAALAALVVIHLVAFRQQGSVGPWRPEKRLKNGPFWPDQVLMDIAAVSVLLVAMVFLSAYWPAQVSGPADPLDNYYEPKPAWPFLFLYQTLKVFHGPMEAVGTALLPLLIIVMFLLVPFLDRREEHSPAKRPVFMAAGFAFAAGVLVLTYFGYASHPGMLNPNEAAAPLIVPPGIMPPAAASSGVTPSGIMPPGVAPTQVAEEAAPGPTLAAAWVGNADHGRLLYGAYCAGCHGQDGQNGLPNPGSTAGAVPALKPIRAALVSEDANEFARNVDRFLQHGSATPGPAPVFNMPAFGDNNALTQQELSAIEAYVMSLNGVDRAEITRPGVPPRIFAWGTLAVFAAAWTVIAVRWRHWRAGKSD
jgi:ubiquinol-cytochrome c reductase cytochrome b subunit